ncbi:MAG: diphthine--ammonia ligase [Coriobacteriia bacterium]|nr:diphthine--ammonia ligase [Coriobacteriia bacterium]
MEKKNFVIAYSGGKDSTLAIDRMIKDGFTCTALIILLSKNGHFSHMHGLDNYYINEIEQCLDIPVIRVNTEEKHDFKNLKNSLINVKTKYNANYACFGDIDQIGMKNFNSKLARDCGLTPVFPLWKNDREQILKEVLDLDYKCCIKVIDSTLLPEDLLGKILDEKMIEVFKSKDIDVCGENGEYHTLVIDGPIFKKPITLNSHLVKKVKDKYSILL